MSVTAAHTVEQHAAADPTWAGTPLGVPHWLESPTGFPPGSVAETGIGSPTDVLTTARRLTLSRRQVDEVVAFAEFLSGRALPDADRAELLDDLVDAFEDSPVTATGFLRPLSAGMRRVASADPVQRATRRLHALTTTWTVEQRRAADGADLNPVMEVVGRHNPVIRHWATSGVVIVADALASRLAQHHIVRSLVGAPSEPDDALTHRLLARLDEAGPVEAADFAAAQVRLLCVRAWLRTMGRSALDNLRQELDRAVRSALDVDIVVQQVGFRAAMVVASTLPRS